MYVSPNGNTYSDIWFDFSSRISPETPYGRAATDSHCTD